MSFLLPPVAGFLYTLGQMVLPAGRPGRALARFYLQQALFFNPRHDRALGYLDYLRGVQQMDRGEPEEALRYLRRAVRALPHDAAVALDTGVAMTIAGEYEAAVHTLSRLLDTHPRRMSQEPQLWFALAWSQVRLGRYREALETARQGAEARAASPGLRLTAALARLGSSGKVEVEVLRGLLRAHPRLLSNLLEFLEQLAEGGKVALTETLLEALPPDLRPRSLRLVLLSSLNREALVSARWALDRLQTLGGRSLELLLLESELRLHEGKPGVAVKAARQARAEARTPAETATAEEQLGEALLLNGREEEAYGHFAEALGLGSASALAGGVVALRLLGQAKVEEARSIFRPARQGRELGVAYAHAATALILLETGHLPEAVALLEQGEEAFRSLPAWAAQRGVVQTLTGALTEGTQRALAAARAADSDELAQRSQRLLRRLTASPQS